MKKQTEPHISTEEALAKAREAHEQRISDGYIDISSYSDDDLRRIAKESLVMMTLNAKGDLKALGAVRELLDRLEGKPVQRTIIAEVGGSKPSQQLKARN